MGIADVSQEACSTNGEENVRTVTNVIQQALTTATGSGLRTIPKAGILTTPNASARVSSRILTHISGRVTAGTKQKEISSLKTVMDAKNVVGPGHTRTAILPGNHQIKGVDANLE